jgi:hypothetical protein
MGMASPKIEEYAATSADPTEAVETATDKTEEVAA